LFFQKGRKDNISSLKCNAQQFFNGKNSKISIIPFEIMMAAYIFLFVL